MIVLYILLAIIIAVVVYVIWIDLSGSNDEKNGRAKKHTTIYPKRTNEELGNIGENAVSYVLNVRAIQPRFFLEDIIYTANGKSCQIDHIFINANGVYVIETKNYSGEIFGKESDENWTQVLNYGQYKFQFYNPIIQNDTHVKVVKSFLPKDIPVFSIVVFVQGNISNVSNNGSVYNARVVRLTDLPQIINRIEPIQITPSQINEVYKLLRDRRDESVTKEQHVQSIKDMKQEIQEKLNDNVCPWCGGRLVVKKGEYGEFYACSNYPDCKYVNKDKKVN